MYKTIANDNESDNEDDEHDGTTLMMASVSAVVVVTVVAASVVVFVPMVAVRGTHKTLNDIILYCLSHALFRVLWPALAAATENGRRKSSRVWGQKVKRAYAAYA